MPDLELPSLTVRSVAAIVAGARPLLVNRDPSPDETDVPLASTIGLELIDPGADGLDRRATKVWIDGVVAFDGSASPEITPAFWASGAMFEETLDSLRLCLAPASPFASQAVVTVRVVSAIKGGGAALDETYRFTAEDRTAPKLVAGVAVAPRALRLAFDEPVTAPDTSSIDITPLGAPVAPVVVTSVTVKANVVDVAVAPEMTPDARYLVRAVAIADAHGNLAPPPHDRLEIAGFRPARPLARRFDLWSMLPKHNRRSDLTGDLASFIACIQEVTDLLLAEVDRFPDIFDLERAPPPFMALVLRDLGNPFPFELDELGQRRLAAVLVEMYRQKGTAVGIRNAVRFFLGIDIAAITGLAETALVLGESRLDVDWELGPSASFARYAFSVTVSRVLSFVERRQLRSIVDYLKPAHTHFVDLIEPLPPIVPDHWEVGISELGLTTVLH